MGEPEGSYSGWSPDALIDRVKALERELQETKKRRVHFFSVYYKHIDFDVTGTVFRTSWRI